MSFWSGQTLRKSIPTYGIVTPYDPKRIDCAAYRLAVGGEYYVSEPEADPSLFRRRRPPVSQLQNANGDSGDTSVEIPPGQFAFLITEETVNVPIHALGFISLRSKRKFKGLVNVSGFHVDPGYHGKLIFAVFNAGPTSTILRRGDDIFLMWLAHLDHSSVVDTKSGKPGINRIESDIVGNMDREVPSLLSLSRQVSEMKNKMRNYVLTGAVIGIIGGFLVTLITIDDVRSFITQANIFSEKEASEPKTLIAE